MNEKPRILIVDDDEVMRRNLTLILDKKGYETESAAAGQEALEKARSGTFHLAYVDQKLPDVQGVDLIALLKEIQPDMAVIMVTSYASVGTAVQALSAGASSYVTKPVNMNHLLAVVKETLAKQRLVDEKQQAEAERNATLEALRANTERLQLAQRIAEIGDWSWDITSGYSEWSEQMYRIFKAPKEQPSYEFARSFVHPDDLALWQNTILQAAEKHEPFAFDYRAIRSDGETIWVHYETQTLFDEQGKLTGYLGTAQDITRRKQAEEDLARAAREWQTTFDAVNDAVWVLNRDQRIVRCNEAAARLFQRPRSELSGKDYWEIVHSTAQLPPGYPIHQASQSLRRESLETQIGEGWFQVTVDPILDATGGYAGAVHVISDITERKRAEEEVLKHREHLEDLVAERTAELAEQYRRQAALAEIELAINQPHELQAVLDRIVQVTTDLLPTSGGASVLLWDAQAKAFTTSASTVPNQSSQTASQRVRREGGATRWIVDHCQPVIVPDVRDNPFDASTMLAEFGLQAYAGVPLLSEGEALGVLYAMDQQPREYTQGEMDFLTSLANRAVLTVTRVRSYEQLRYSYELLEERTAELGKRMAEVDQLNQAMTNLLEDLQAANRNLEATARKLQEVNRELEDFAYVVSHDLKAPLRGIIRLADWLSTDYAAALDEEGQEMLRLLTGRTRRMHNLIEGILQYSRVGRVREREKRLDLDRIVQGVIEMLAPPPQIQVRVEGNLPTVVTERTRLEQVFQNLLSNAIRFMDKSNGLVIIECVDGDAYWQFSIADNGPGIEAQFHDKVFHLFQTLAPRDEVESTGIGLALVKKIVEGWGGRVWLESTPGEGSTFYFTLPK